MPKLLEIAADYTNLRCAEPKLVMITMARQVKICGNKDIQDYGRKVPNCNCNKR